MDESGRDNTDTEIELCLPEQPPPNWEREKRWKIKYVDDLTTLQHHYLPSAISTFTMGREHRLIYADECEAAFATIKLNAEQIGMRVNDKKRSYSALLVVCRTFLPMSRSMMDK